MLYLYILCIFIYHMRLMLNSIYNGYNSYITAIYTNQIYLLIF